MPLEHFKYFFETIKVKDGKLLNLKYHQQRVDRTRSFFSFNTKLELIKQEFELPKKGLFRLRVDYARSVKLSTCTELTCREFREFRVVESDTEYGFKYANRDKLDALKRDKKEIIIAKDGFIRDTTISNIALLIDGIWLTPKNPLLAGTTRARLIDEGFLRCEELSVEDLEKAESFAIMNALIDFKIVKEVRIELGAKHTICKSR